MQILSWSLVRNEHAAHRKLSLAILFGAWLLTVAWLASNHVVWRDEVRAFSLALSGSNFAEMLRNIHGEGHPALWYLILRAAHDVFPFRQVLPVTGAVFGIAAMAVLTFCSPFRTFIIALILFSLFGAFEYIVLARNYGIAALCMFVLAAIYPRVKNSLWFGVLLALLSNTNVPACLLAAAFVIFRFVEIVTAKPPRGKRDWQIFAANCAVALAGALICFRTVYPTFNDGAVSTNFGALTAAQFGAALVDGHQGFSNLGLSVWAGLPPIVLTLSCLAFVRKPPALCASFAALLLLKLFFFFVYLSYYRHEALFLVFLLCLHWMTAQDSRGLAPNRLLDSIQFIGVFVFVELLALQTALLSSRIHDRIFNIPYSSSAEVAQLLRQPQLKGAIVMADPDTMLEPLAYYVDNPLWFLREQKYGQFARLTRKARQHLTLDDILADARNLNAKTGRPVIFLSQMPLSARSETKRVMFDDTTSITPANYERFTASTHLIARLRRAGSDEAYDVYEYPRKP
jgi:hypothetical protein